MLLAALALVSFQSKLDMRITFQFTGAVDALLKQLGTKAGLEMDAAVQQRKIILIVAFDNVPLSEVMSRIAWATYGRWDSKENGYRLSRDTGLENGLKKEFYERAVKRMTDGIREYGKQVLGDEISDRTAGKLLKDWKDKEAKLRYGMPSGNSSLVAERALARALAVIKPSDLVDNRDVLDPVYSDQPTLAQRPLGKAGREILDRYNAEIEAWEKANPERASHGTERAATRILVSASCGVGLYGRITLFAADGSIVGKAMHAFRGVDEAQPSGFPPELTKAIPERMDLPLSKESAFFVNAPTEDNLWPPKISQSEELRRRLSDPERVDPLSTFMTDLWVAAAKASHRSLAVCIPDAAFVPPQPRTEYKLLDCLRSRWREEDQFEPGWIVARPKIIRSSYDFQADRKALAKFLLAPKGFAALEAAGELAATWEGYFKPFNCEDLAQWVTGEGFPSENWSFLRFFGTLPPDVRRRWCRGESIAVSELSGACRRALLQWGIETNLPQTLANEPTVRFPQGLPDQGYLRADVVSTPGVYVRIHYPDGHVAAGWTSYWLLAFDLNAREQGLRPWMGDFEIKEVPKQEFRLYVEFGPGDAVDGVRFAGPDPDPSGYVPWSQAPATLKARMAEEQKKAKQASEGG